MKKQTNVALIVIVLVGIFFLAGCQSKLLVRNATVDQITPILKDYAGIHGYQISYQNVQTGSYRLDMGSVYMPNTIDTVKNKSTIVSPAVSATGQPMTAYEETTWHTVNVPGRYVDAAATVQIMKQDQDVYIIIDTNDAAGTSLNDLYDFLQAHGYTVEHK
jgi:hypothetical protein